MRKVYKRDDEGYLRCYLVRDGDSDDAIGIPLSPINVMLLDLHPKCRKALNDILVQRGLFSWHDVVSQQSSIVGAVNTMRKERSCKLSDAEAGELRKTLTRMYKHRR